MTSDQHKPCANKAPHCPNPLSSYEVLGAEYPGEGFYNFTTLAPNLEEFRKWCAGLCGDDWFRGGMDSRIVVERDAAGRELAQGTMRALWQSLHVHGLIPGDCFTATEVPGGEQKITDLDYQSECVKAVQSLISFFCGPLESDEDYPSPAVLAEGIRKTVMELQDHLEGAAGTFRTLSKMTLNQLSYGASVTPDLPEVPGGEQ